MCGLWDRSVRAIVGAVLVAICATTGSPWRRLDARKGIDSTTETGARAARGTPNKPSREQVVVQELDAQGLRKLIGRSGGRQRPLMLYLWYTGCQPCRERLSDVIRVDAEYRSRGLDVALLSVSPIDSKAALSALLTERRINLPAYLLNRLDDELAEEVFLKDWEVTVPSVFFYDAAGRQTAAEIELSKVRYDTLRRDAVIAVRSVRKSASQIQHEQQEKVLLSQQRPESSAPLTEPRI